MVGFGFVDNVLMLTAGDAIDQSLGVALQISTLAAAGLGNLFSDVCGLGLSSYIEAMSGSLGIKAPELTRAQLALPRSRAVALVASVLGITTGCLLGMVPLLFLPVRNDHDHDSASMEGELAATAPAPEGSAVDSCLVEAWRVRPSDGEAGTGPEVRVSAAVLDAALRTRGMPESDRLALLAEIGNSSHAFGGVGEACM